MNSRVTSLNEQTKNICTYQDKLTKRQKRLILIQLKIKDELMMDVKIQKIIATIKNYILTNYQILKK